MCEVPGMAAVGSVSITLQVDHLDVGDVGYQGFGQSSDV